MRDQSPSLYLGAARASRSGSAAVVVARRGKSASSRSSSVRRRAITDARSSVGGTEVPLIWPVRLRPQPRWIWIRREAASADGFGIRISRTPSI